MLELLLTGWLIASPIYSFGSDLPVNPAMVITPKQEADYFENRLGVIEVGITTKELLERYTGIGEEQPKKFGETVYYLDPVNKKTLIIETNRKGVIEVARYKNFIELPPGKKSIADVKISAKPNIKNLMTSKGSRLGYNYMRIINGYGRPSVDINYKEKGTKIRELKYILLGEQSEDDYIYLEYSFRLENNKVTEIRIENGH